MQYWWGERPREPDSARQSETAAARRCLAPPKMPLQRSWEFLVWVSTKMPRLRRWENRVNYSIAFGFEIPKYFCSQNCNFLYGAVLASGRKCLITMRSVFFARFAVS